jgi:hypothetical protein
MIVEKGRHANRAAPVTAWKFEDSPGRSFSQD